MRQRCEVCNREIICNETNKCYECTIRTSGKNENRGNQYIVNAREVERRKNEAREAITRRRKKVEK